MNEAYASSTPSHMFHFGINGLNNMISQILKQPVLNIHFQSREKIKTTIQFLGKWVLYERSHDHNITSQHLTIHIVVGFL